MARVEIQFPSVTQQKGVGRVALYAAGFGQDEAAADPSPLVSTVTVV